MATTYEPAPTVAALAAELIVRHHSHLVDVPIMYLFVSPTPKERDRFVLGRARRVSGLAAYLVALAAGEVEDLVDDAGEDSIEEDRTFFVMEIARDEWDDAVEEERAALVDHELCHFTVNDKGELRLRAHDVEEFRQILERHGAWNPDLAAFLASGASVGAVEVAS